MHDWKKNEKCISLLFQPGPHWDVNRATGHLKAVAMLMSRLIQNEIFYTFHTKGRVLLFFSNCIFVTRKAGRWHTIVTYYSKCFLLQLTYLTPINSRNATSSSYRQTYFIRKNTQGLGSCSVNLKYCTIAFMLLKVYNNVKRGTLQMFQYTHQLLIV